MIFLQLFLSYLKIGFFGFGGGYAMLALIQHEVVVRHSWMTNTEFTDIVAISQMTPGPIAINSATYVGYTVGMQAGDNTLFGILGSAIATLAVCLPSLTVMLLLMFPASHEGESFIDGWSWAIFGVCVLASWRKVNPILLIVLSAVAGILIYHIF